MERSILFRGFNINKNGNEVAFIYGEPRKGKWVTGSLSLALDEEEDKNGYRAVDYYILGLRGDIRIVVPDTIGQYIGRNDYSGNPIFEDYIVKFKTCEAGHWNTGVVKYNERSCAYVIEYEVEKNPVPKYVTLFSDIPKDDYIEIIGDIHSTPDFLSMSNKYNEPNKSFTKIEISIKPEEDNDSIKEQKTKRTLDLINKNEKNKGEDK